MKILFLSRWFPHPADNGSKIRINNLLRGLSERHDVTLLGFSDQPYVDLEAPELRMLCQDAEVIPWKEFDPHRWRSRIGFLDLKPRSIVDTFSPEMANKIQAVLNRRRYDLIIASQLSMAAYYPYFKDVPALFEEAEIGLSYTRVCGAGDFGKRLRQALTWFKLRHYLSQLFGFFPASTVVSEQERALLRQNFPHAKQIEVIPNCLNVSEYENIRAEPKPKSLIFSGSFRYAANYEAMVWFIREVFPIILEQIPDAHLTITGDHADLPLPSNKGISLTGHVHDIKKLIASSSVSVAPLLTGGGTRLKILEAMALGTPVVATRKGTEGLEAEDGKHLLVTDGPEEFADHVIKMLSENSLRQRVVMNASQFVREKYDWGIVMPQYLRLIEQVAAI